MVFGELRKKRVSTLIILNKNKKSFIYWYLIQRILKSQVPPISYKHFYSENKDGILLDVKIVSEITFRIHADFLGGEIGAMERYGKLYFMGEKKINVKYVYKYTWIHRVYGFNNTRFPFAYTVDDNGVRWNELRPSNKQKFHNNDHHRSRGIASYVCSQKKRLGSVHLFAKILSLLLRTFAFFAIKVKK